MLLIINILYFLAYPFLSNWEFQPIDCSTGKECDVHRFILEKRSAEYDQVHDLFKGSLGYAVPNAEVVKIERIQNPRLYEIFEGQKKKMSNGGNEMRLFHRTAKQAVKNINMSGFNRAYCGKNGKLICFVTFRSLHLLIIKN